MAAQDNGQTRDSDRQSDLAVMDANEYKQKRRLERILDSMDCIDEAVKRAKDLFAAGEIDIHGRRMLFHDAVKHAIWQCWTLLLDHQRKRERQAEADDHDGPANSEYLIGSEANPLGRIQQVKDSDIVIRGLWDYFVTDELWTETWTERTKPRNLPTRTSEKEVQHSVPDEISWAAAFRLKEFLDAEHDLEVKFEALEERRPYDDWREEFGEKGYTGPEDVDAPHKNV